MASNPLLTLLFSFFTISSLFAVSLSSKPSHHDLKWWCDQTPNPDTCNHFLTRNNPQYPTSTSSSASISRPMFRKTAIELAMGRAITAQAHNYKLGPKCRSKKEKAAWADCLTLYNDLVSHLNTTLTKTKCTDFDSQTWLSAALTDLDTCRAGFADLGLSGSPLLPNNHNNVSKLLSNALALSNYNATNFVATSSVDSDGFPSWVSAGNRRLLQSGGSVPPADITVAKDGSGDFRTVKEAITAAGQRQRSGRRFVIRIKSGVYKENVEIGKKLKNIMLVGDGMRSTVITGSRSVGGGSTTFNSATVVVTGDGFIARDITFRNTASAKNHQAVALRSGADLSAFYKCSFEGYQDTLYVHSNRQFYRECYIYGTVDFIFGNAAAVLQNCMIYARRPMAKQKITITAQGRTDPNQNTGISIHNSRVMAGSDLRPVVGSFKTFLGRPWKTYSRTVFMQTFLDSLVDPAGWLEWDGNFALRTLYYGEYRNTGPGAPTGRRVKWAGYRVITSASEAGRFSVGNFIAGRSWIPGTGIPFTSGL
ncbi:Probable pectinesterase/pectinesterase inhibitor 17 [Linum grandiflorum]